MASAAAAVLFDVHRREQCPTTLPSEVECFATIAIIQIQLSLYVQYHNHCYWTSTHVLGDEGGLEAALFIGIHFLAAFIWYAG